MYEKHRKLDTIKDYLLKEIMDENNTPISSNNIEIKLVGDLLPLVSSMLNPRLGQITLLLILTRKLNS